MSSVSTASEDVADRERRRAREMSIGEVTSHIRNRTWPARAPDADVGPLEAWCEAVPVHYPGAANGTVARFHAPTEMILLARQGGLLTCIELSDRPRDEQHYIRTQVSL